MFSVLKAKRETGAYSRNYRSLWWTRRSFSSSSNLNDLKAYFKRDFSLSVIPTFTSFKSGGELVNILIHLCLYFHAILYWILIDG